MKQSDLASKAFSYLTTLCSAGPDRRTGSAGNREATDFFASIVRQFGYEVDATPFDCLDHVTGEAVLASDDQSFDIHISPYSLGCDVTAELVTARSVQELESCACKGKLLLLAGEICAEQLMPKGFVFYNPDHHKHIYSLLEEKEPAGIITATERKPEQVGALYPFPLIVDGDFDIPSVYCTDTVGEEIAYSSAQAFRLFIDARRIPSTASNVIAWKNPGAGSKVVVTAHIDTYEDSPGASDNASGTVVLLLLAEMLSEYQVNSGIEIAAFNGEDHYTAGGQMDYLHRYGGEFESVAIAINIDDVGYREGGSAYSFYGCPPEILERAESAFGDFQGVIPGEPWYSGDHMIFVQAGVPAMAFTAEMMPKLMATVTHTPQDTPEIIDPAKLVEVALALKGFIEQS